MSAIEISERYFAAMTGQHLKALADLFAEDGVIVWPNGTRLEGNDAISEAYAQLFKLPTNNPHPGPLLIAAPDHFACEGLSRLPDGSERRTLNVFRLNRDGLIARLDSYRQDQPAD